MKTLVGDVGDMVGMAVVESEETEDAAQKNQPSSRMLPCVVRNCDGFTFSAQISHLSLRFCLMSSCLNVYLQMDKFNSKIHITVVRVAV